MSAALPDRSRAVTLAVAGFLETCRSANTRSAYETDLAQFAAWCARGERLNLLSVATDDLARYRTACEAGGLSPATIARRLSAITSFRRYAEDHGYQPALDTDSTLERPTLQSESTADVLTDDDATALLDAADRTSTRSAVLIRLLMLDGLKVGEALRADASDVRGRSPRTTLDIRGRASPAVVLHPDSGRAVRRYLGRRREGPLLLSEPRGRPPDRLTRFGIDYLIKQVAQAAALDPTVSGNTLRRRYVIAAHMTGTDLERIRHNTGHADPRTTRRYLEPDCDTDAVTPLRMKSPALRRADERGDALSE